MPSKTKEKTYQVKWAVAAGDDQDSGPNLGECVRVELVSGQHADFDFLTVEFLATPTKGQWFSPYVFEGLETYDPTALRSDEDKRKDPRRPSIHGEAYAWDYSKDVDVERPCPDCGGEFEYEREDGESEIFICAKCEKTVHCAFNRVGEVIA